MLITFQNNGEHLSIKFDDAFKQAKSLIEYVVEKTQDFDNFLIQTELPEHIKRKNKNFSMKMQGDESSNI